MIFRFTKSAQNKLKIRKLPMVPPSENLFYEWYVNVFFCNRYKYFVTTNAATLFTVIIYGAGIKDDNDYFDYIFSALRQQMEEASLEFIYRRRIATNTGEITLSNTNNRSVLGSINDIIMNAQHLLENENISPFDVGKYINQTPFSYIGMKYPMDEMKKINLNG